MGALSRWEHRPESYYEYPEADLKAKDDRDHGRDVVTCPQCGWARAWRETGTTYLPDGAREEFEMVRCQRSARHGPNGWLPKCQPWKRVLSYVPGSESESIQTFLFNPLD